MSAAYQLDVGELQTMTCGAEGCGVAFAMPSAMYARKLQDGTSWYCPNGHERCFRDNENARLKHELAQAQKKLEWKEQEVQREKVRTTLTENRRRAQKAANTKMRKRVCAGVCPLCKEELPDLAAHVAAKHPSPSKSQDSEAP